MMATFCAAEAEKATRIVATREGSRMARMESSSKFVSQYGTDPECVPQSGTHTRSNWRECCVLSRDALRGDAASEPDLTDIPDRRLDGGSAEHASCNAAKIRRSVLVLSDAIPGRRVEPSGADWCTRCLANLQGRTEAKRLVVSATGWSICDVVSARECRKCYASGGSRVGRESGGLGNAGSRLPRLR